MAWPPRFLFISGRLAIDFVHTGGEGFRARYERWHSPKDLAEWSVACPGLGVAPSVTGSDLRRARALREAIWSCAVGTLAGRGLPRRALALIEASARRPDLVPILRRGRVTYAPPVKADAVLSSVARDAIALFGGKAKERLRQCANPRCFLLFVDSSRPGKRAWCTMRRCGNLQKLARHRSRCTSQTRVASRRRRNQEP